MIFQIYYNTYRICQNLYHIHYDIVNLNMYILLYIAAV